MRFSIWPTSDSQGIAEMTPVEVRKYCQSCMDDADLAASDGIAAAHLAEAVQYRYRAAG